MEISKMAQNTQDGNVGSTPEDVGLQLQIPGLKQFSSLKFVQSEANPADLIIQFPDGSETVIPNYIPLAQAGAPPALTLEDGTVIPGTEIVGLIDNLDYDKIATAAGDPGAGGQTTTGGGAGFLADPSGLLGDDIGHGPYAGGIRIADQVGFEQLPSENGPGEGGGDLPFEAIDDHVIHNIQAEDDFRFQGSGFNPLTNPIDIPDEALRHNDIYPRGSWDLESVHSPSPDYNPTYAYPGESNDDPFPADPFEDPTVGNSDPNLDPNTHDLGTSTFNGTNTTSRFTGTTTIIKDGVDTGVIGIYNNSGEFYELLDLPTQTTQVGQVERVNWDLGRFTLQTEAPGGHTPDWDGTRIYLYEGETITMTPDGFVSGLDGEFPGPDVGASPGPGDHRPPESAGDVWAYQTNYWMGICVDGQISTGDDPLFDGSQFGARFGWDHLELVEYDSVNVLEYTAASDGYIYLGIGNIPTTDTDNNPLSGGTEVGQYRTLVEIDGVPYGEFDYEATDEVLSDGAHVTVDAREEGTLYDSGDAGRGLVDVINGTAGDDIIISSHWSDDLYGLGGDDVLIGRGGDDHLYGGDGRDLFLFENASTDGHDTIFDFDPTGDGDIINLDALFDVLLGPGVATSSDVTATSVTGGMELTVTGVDSSVFSITLAGATSFDVDGLITTGNLVVDES